MKRVLCNGVFPDGRVVPHTIMPWACFSNRTEEDRHAVVVYLRHLPAVHHQTPEPASPAAMRYPGAVLEVYGGKDYSVRP